VLPNGMPGSLVGLLPACILMACSFCVPTTSMRDALAAGLQGDELIPPEVPFERF
jgi:hypothetical protein